MRYQSTKIRLTVSWILNEENYIDNVMMENHVSFSIVSNETSNVISINKNIVSGIGPGRETISLDGTLQNSIMIFVYEETVPILSLHATLLTDLHLTRNLFFYMHDFCVFFFFFAKLEYE